MSRRAIDVADLPFVWLSHIDQLNCLAGRATDRELARLDLRNGVESGTFAAARRAELVVVDELLQLASSARRARRIAPHADRSEIARRVR